MTTTVEEEDVTSMMVSVAERMKGPSEPSAVLEFRTPRNIVVVVDEDVLVGSTCSGSSGVGVIGKAETTPLPW